MVNLMLLRAGRLSGHKQEACDEQGLRSVSSTRHCIEFVRFHSHASDVVDEDFTLLIPQSLTDVVGLRKYVLEGNVWDRLRYVHGARRFDSQNWRDATKVALFLNDRLLTRSSVRSSWSVGLYL